MPDGSPAVSIDRGGGCLHLRGWSRCCGTIRQCRCLKCTSNPAHRMPVWIIGCVGPPPCWIVEHVLLRNARVAGVVEAVRWTIRRIRRGCVLVVESKRQCISCTPAFLLIRDKVKLPTARPKICQSVAGLRHHRPCDDVVRWLRGGGGGRSNSDAAYQQKTRHPTELHPDTLVQRNSGMRSADIIEYAPHSPRGMRGRGRHVRSPMSYPFCLQRFFCFQGSKAPC